MKITRCLALSVALCAALAASASTRTTAPPAPLPTDPKALLQLASQVNGLHGSGMKPWHVHASWRAVDRQKHVTSQGTLEEWWAAENQYKIACASAGFQQTLYVTDHGAWIIGDPDTPNYNFSLAAAMFTDPLPDRESISALNLQLLQHRQRDLILTCVAPKSNPPLPQYCFTDNLPAVRVIARADARTGLSAIARFQGQYVAQQIEILRQRKDEIDVQVDQIEPISTVSAADFAPPPGALPASAHPVFVDSSLLQDSRISGKLPQYPAMARTMGVQGTVVLQATIARDGTIADLKVVSGPEMLVHPATEAVKSWQYRPYLLGGKPVSIRTEIDVMFSLGP